MTFVDVVASLHGPRPGCIACIVRNAGIARNDCNTCNDEETSNDATTYSVLHTRHPWPGFRDRTMSLQNIIPNWDTPSGTFSQKVGPFANFGTFYFYHLSHSHLTNRAAASDVVPTTAGPLHPCPFYCSIAATPLFPSSPSVCHARPDFCPHRGRS